MQEMRIPTLGWEDPLEKEMTTHSSILAWEIPWTEEPGGLQSMGCKELHTTEHNTGERNGTTLQYSCLENPMDRGAWWAAVHRVAQSRTRLKQLSSSRAQHNPHDNLKTCSLACFHVFYIHEVSSVKHSCCPEDIKMGKEGLFNHGVPG